MRTFLILTAVCCLFSCSSELPVKEYIRWVEDEDNGLHVTKSIKGNEVILQYQPVEYIAILNLRQEGVTKEKLTPEILGLKGYHYFLFKIKPVFPVDSNEDYFNFQLGDKFRLINQEDTINCTFFHQESTLNFSPYLTFLMAFKNDGPLTEDLIFEFKDETFGVKDLQIKIDKNKLKNIPSLKID